MSGKPTHGLSYTPEYKAWQTMRLRCTVPTNSAYANYGGRGITVCERWLESPANFIADMGPKPSPAHELDRKDNDKGYAPENCRWVTRTVNDRNRRSNRLLTHAGETLPLVEWAERYALPRDTLLKRIDGGWDVSVAILTPIRPKASKGHGKTKKYACPTCGIRETAVMRCIVCSNKSRALSVIKENP
jgi:hypothetical protein